MNRKVKVTVGDVYNLNGAINDFVTSVPFLSGKVAYAFTKTAKKLESVIKPLEEERAEFGKEFFEYDDKGVVFEELPKEAIEKGQMPLPKLLEGKTREDYANKVAELMKPEIDLEVYQIPLADWEALQFDPRRI